MTAKYAWVAELSSKAWCILCYNYFMRIIESKIDKAELLKSEIVFDGPMIKAVVDIAKGVVAVDAGLHADLERFLLEHGSEQDNLWGINLYPEDTPDDFVEFDSMINVRPRQNNRSRYVEDAETRAKILEVVYKWLN